MPKCSTCGSDMILVGTTFTARGVRAKYKCYSEKCCQENNTSEKFVSNNSVRR